MQREMAAFRGHAYLVAPAVAGCRVPPAKGFGLLRAVVHLAHPGAVVIEVGVGTLGGQGLDQLVFGGGHTLDGLERFQVLRSHRGDDADGRMHQTAHLLDVAHVPRPHLPHKHLMRGGQLLPDGAGDAHGGIEAGGRDERGIFLAQDRAQNMLDRRFAVAARDADANQPGVGKQLLPGVAEVAFADRLFNRPGQEPAQGHHQRKRQRPQRGQHRPGRGGTQRADARHHQKKDRIQPLDASGEHKFLFGAAG